MQKKYFIYLTTNLINHKKYIGYHYGYENDDYLGSGVLLQKALKEYGRQNFKRQILEICKTQEEAFEQEKYWIKYYNAVENQDFYNISEGGEFDAGWSQANKWFKNHPEQAQQIYQQNIQNVQSWWKEHPEELEKNNKNLIENAKKWREEYPEKVKEHMKKVNQAKEQWQKEHPLEHQQQIDAWRKAGSDANSQKIQCITTGEIFDSISEAARRYTCYGCSQPNITKVLKGERQSCGKKDGQKLKWKKL